MEPTTGDRFDLVEYKLSIAEGVEDRGDGPQLDAHVTEEQHHVGDAGQLEQGGADPLGPGWGLDLHEPLGGQDERHFVGETAQPVDPVDERGDLRVGADLGELLVTAVHVAHDRLCGNHPFAVEADDYPEGPVGGRVLGPDVEGHAFGLEFHIHPGVAGLPSDVGHLSGLGRCGHESSPSSPSSASSWPGMSSTSTMPGQGFTRRASSG